jgi:hypothetical protein
VKALTDRLPLKFRIGLYFLLYVMIWCVWCLPPLLSLDHNGFQASGTVIICWAIFFIGRDRLRFEKSITEFERNAIIAAVNRLEAHRSTNEKRLNLTFNIHQHQISRLSLHVRLPNPVGPQNKMELDDFGKSIQEDISNSPEEYVLSEDKALNESLAEMRFARTEYGRWKEYAFKCEIGFLVVGTLQTGYGAAASAYFSQIGVTEAVNSVIHF